MKSEWCYNTSTVPVRGGLYCFDDGLLYPTHEKDEQKLLELERYNQDQLGKSPSWITRMINSVKGLLELNRVEFRWN